MACATRSFPSLFLRGIPRLLRRPTYPFLQHLIIPCVSCYHLTFVKGIATDVACKRVADMAHHSKHKSSRLERIASHKNFDPIATVENISAYQRQGYQNIDELVDDVTVDLFKDDCLDDAMAFVKEVIRRQIPIKPKSYSSVLKEINNKRLRQKNSDLDQQFVSFLSFIKQNCDVPHNYKGIPFEILRFAANSGEIELAQTSFNMVHWSQRCYTTHFLMLLSYLKNADMTGNYDKWPDVAKCFSNMIDIEHRKNYTLIIKLVDYARRCDALEDLRSMLEKLPQDQPIVMQFMEHLDNPMKKDLRSLATNSVSDINAAITKKYMLDIYKCDDDGASLLQSKSNESKRKGSKVPEQLEQALSLEESDDVEGDEEQVGASESVLDLESNCQVSQFSGVDKTLPEEYHCEETQEQMNSCEENCLHTDLELIDMANISEYHSEETKAQMNSQEVNCHNSKECAEPASMIINEERNYALKNFNPLCAADMISIFHRDGLGNVSDVVKAVERHLLKDDRTDEYLAFVKELVAKEIPH